MVAVKSGSQEAFEDLFDRYRSPLWRFFRRRMQDAGRAEELTHDVFVAVLQSTTRYEPRAPFKSYLFGIAYNVLLADRRKARSRHAQLHDAVASAAVSVDHDLGLWIRGALEQLEEADREILMLREYEQLSYDEIAHLKALPLNTVRSRLFRARMALKDVLQSSGRVQVRGSHHEGR